MAGVAPSKIGVPSLLAANTLLNLIEQQDGWGSHAAEALGDGVLTGDLMPLVSKYFTVRDAEGPRSRLAMRLTTELNDVLA